MATSSVNLLDIFCQDPVFGSVDRYLINGGSWYEADQMYWRMIQRQAVDGLRKVTMAKPTKSNQEKAETYLNSLKDTSSQLFPTEDSMAIFHQADSVVKNWVPPMKTAVAPKNNVFALLGADSEEEE